MYTDKEVNARFYLYAAGQRAQTGHMNLCAGQCKYQRKPTSSTVDLGKYFIPCDSKLFLPELHKAVVCFYFNLR